jgi:DNA-3-methyladenine glycosylase II
MEGSLQCGEPVQSVGFLKPETVLSARDPTLAKVIASQSARWPQHPTEDPVWGLLRIVMAQQISTAMACRLAERVKAAYPTLVTGSSKPAPELKSLCKLGLTQQRARCCLRILEMSDAIREHHREGRPLGEALAGIKGIGPWTLSVFRIMVLRDTDELPLRDVGLERAIATAYGPGQRVEILAEHWRPFRSVACWYLWRTLGNEQLG